MSAPLIDGLASCWSPLVVWSEEHSVNEEGSGHYSTEVEIFYANNCTGEFLHFLGGTAQQTVRVAADLSSATLVAVVPVVSDDGAGANVTVNVTWTANAPTSKAERTTRSRSGDTLLLEHAVFEARAADVSGTLATVLPLAAGPTFVDLGRLPEGGQLGAGLDGTRTVTFSDGHP